MGPIEEYQGSISTKQSGTTSSKDLVYFSLGEIKENRLETIRGNTNAPQALPISSHPPNALRRHYQAPHLGSPFIIIIRFNKPSSKPAPNVRSNKTKPLYCSGLTTSVHIKTTHHKPTHGTTVLPHLLIFYFYQLRAGDYLTCSSKPFVSASRLTPGATADSIREPVPSDWLKKISRHLNTPKM